MLKSQDQLTILIRQQSRVFCLLLYQQSMSCQPLTLLLGHGVPSVSLLGIEGLDLSLYPSIRVGRHDVCIVAVQL